MSLPVGLLGKKAPRLDRRTLQFGNYVGELPPPPEAHDLTGKVADWPMMLNDRIGDCAIVSAAHMIQAWTANSGNPVVPTDDDVLTAYSAVSGYDPETGLNDNGCVLLDVLNYWRTVGIGGHKIGAFAALEPENPRQIETAIWLFGGVYIGLALPLTAKDQRVWTVPPGGPVGDGAPNSWGGHGVPQLLYRPTGQKSVTWGRLQDMTWNFWRTYCDEAYSILSTDWVDGSRPAPNGFALEDLQADLRGITS